MFIWLAGEEATQALEPWPMGQDEDESWSPSAAEWYWVDAPLEVIRFAAANHLCLGLGYGGSTREIEPYSLRKTRAGDILLSLKLSEAAQAGRPLEEIMDEMSRIAQERGLTPAILRAGDHATG